MGYESISHRDGLGHGLMFQKDEAGMYDRYTRSLCAPARTSALLLPSGLFEPFGLRSMGQRTVVIKQTSN
jgi:hypothetical protein